MESGCLSSSHGQIAGRGGAGGWRLREITAHQDLISCASRVHLPYSSHRMLHLQSFYNGAVVLCVFTYHKHSFSAPCSPSIPANSNLAQMQQGEVQLEKGDQIKRGEKWKGHQKEGRKQKEKKEKHDQRIINHVGVCAKKAINNPSPDPSLQLNVAFGEAQRCACLPTHAGR